MYDSPLSHEWMGDGFNCANTHLIVGRSYRKAAGPLNKTQICSGTSQEAPQETSPVTSYWMDGSCRHTVSKCIANHHVSSTMALW